MFYTNFIGGVQEPAGWRPPAGSHETPGRTLTFPESVGVLKDVRTSYTNQPKANEFFSWDR